MHVSVATALDTTAFEQYLLNPIVVAAHQCFSKSSDNIFVKHGIVDANYYGIPLAMEVVQEDIEKDRIISAEETCPYHILRQLAFYKKCKEVKLGSVRYLYAKMLAEQLATVTEPTSIAKPAANRNCNCYYKKIDWVLDIHGHRLKGSSNCLVSLQTIRKGEVLIYKQSKKEQLKTRKKIIENFPLVFKLSNGQWRCPKNVIDVPVYLDGQLTNFMEVKDKEGPFGLCFGEINSGAQKYHIRFKSAKPLQDSYFDSEAPQVPKRVVHIKFQTETGLYKIVKIVNPNI